MTTPAPEPAHVLQQLQQLQQLLGGDALAALRQRLRRAYERVDADAEAPPLRLAGLLPHEAAALQDLTGRRTRATASLLLEPATLSASLRAAGLASGLRAALELLDGPIAPRRAERAAALLAWADVARQATHPALLALLADAQGLGLLKRLAAGSPAAAATLCEAATRVLAALPSQGRPRASLAASCLGDAHALDTGRPVATLVLAALRRAARDGADAGAAASDPAIDTASDTANEQASEQPSNKANDDSEGVRAVWASQGVAVNELARPALSLNLPVASARGDGVPRYWPLRQLLRQPPPWDLAGRAVFVCENPNLLAMAADALGQRCAPLVCTDGMPAAAQRTLLRQLQAAGARLHYHGDFDWPGLTIGNQLVRHFGAVPWRFGSHDYCAALADRAHVRASLRGNPVVAAWDEALLPAMAAAGCALPEEALFDTLRDDLGT